MIDLEQVKEDYKYCTEPINFVDRYEDIKSYRNITDKNDIFATLQGIEKMDMLAALFIAEIEEKKLANEYCMDFWKRYKDRIIPKVKINNLELQYYMSILFICLSEMNDVDCKNIVEDVFGGSIYRTEVGEVTEFENDKLVTKHFSKNLAQVILNFPQEYEWYNHYFRIVKNLCETRKSSEVIRFFEVELRKNRYGYVFDNELARDYFHYMIDHKAYEGAKCFLENFDGSQGYLDMDINELVQILLSQPSSEMITYARYLVKLHIDPDYSYDKMLADVSKVNSDQDIIKWIKLTKYFKMLRLLFEAEEYEEFENLLEQCDEYELFEITKIRHLKKLTIHFMYIVNSMILKRPDLLMPFLEKIKHINFNRLSYAKYLCSWNNMEEVGAEYDYDEIENDLFANFAIEDVVHIYMHSHLKGVILLEHFLERCAQVYGEDLFELFKNYPIFTKATLGSRYNSIRDKIFFSPIGIANNIGYLKYVRVNEQSGPNSEEATLLYKKLIRCDQCWYSDNKKYAELVSDDDYCTVNIKSYMPGKGIYVSNVWLYDNIKEKREAQRNNEYPPIVFSWLADIRDKKTVPVWNEKYKVYSVRHIDNAALRCEIAEGIFNTVVVLQDNVEELEKYLNAISNVPVEEINEFRYIPTQKNLPFEFGRERFQILRKDVIEKFKQILQNPNIPSRLKKRIYINTCARKIFDFKEVCRYIGTEFYLESVEEPFIMALKYVRAEDDKYYFASDALGNTFYSSKEFVYTGSWDNLREGENYLVELKDYDFDNGYFTLSKVGLISEDISIWKKYLRTLREVKKATEQSEIDRIKNDLAQYDVNLLLAGHISQFTYELNLIFERKMYDIKSALMVMDIIGDRNPYLGKDISFYIYSNNEEYECTYQKFLDNYKNGDALPTEFCDLIFSSYLKLFVDKESFLADISSDAQEMQSIREYCIQKDYI